MEDKKQKTIDYINEVIRPPRKEFGGLPTCPFAGPELDKDNLMIDVISENQNLDFLIDKFINSKYNSALLILDLSNDTTIAGDETSAFASFVDKLMESKGIGHMKAVCFNPNDTISTNDYNPRQKAPYFLINIAEKKELYEAYKSLTKTKYYDNLDVKYKDFLFGGKDG